MMHVTIRKKTDAPTVKVQIRAATTNLAVTNLDSIDLVGSLLLLHDYESFVSNCYEGLENALAGYGGSGG